MVNFNIDISETEIIGYDKYLLDSLLIDRSKSLFYNKTCNIIWATDNYSPLGEGFKIDDPILSNNIINEYGLIIRPRVKKTKTEQVARARNKAEVFTPSWLCNKQNNLVDENWFGEKFLFNKEINYSWDTNNKKIKFPTKDGKLWTDYVLSTRLEISCGEAPYLVSRYDTITGQPINIIDRIGILDRKIRVINENTYTENDWMYWVLKAYQSIYGFELQGDNLLLARENLLYTFEDYYKERFNKQPEIEQCRNIADIISWNIWQMDALTCLVPHTCHEIIIEHHDIFSTTKTTKQCPGCKKNSLKEHNGIYCLVKDWKTGKITKFVDSL